MLKSTVNMISTDELNRRYELWQNGYWEVPDNLDITSFNFDWRPDPWDRPYIHQFGTQWQRTNGPRFIVPNSEGIKYQDCQFAIKKNIDNNWVQLVPNATLDTTWHPDENDPPYIYVFGNQWYSGEVMPTYQYAVEGATEKKYISDIVATLLPDRTKWIIPDDIVDNFDYSWVPNPYEEPYIYQFGTQWQKTGGPRYVVENATQVKYVSEFVSTKKPNKSKFLTLVDNVEFDYSWHPDDTEPDFNYVFGNQHYDSALMPTVIYQSSVDSTTKYVDTIKATLLPDRTKWIIPEYIDDSMFDYSWVPNPHEPLQNYQFGTQWQISGGPKLVFENATDTKFMDNMSVVKLQNKDDRAYRPLYSNIEFDYSWHPNPEDPPYIYVFGNQWYDAEKMPTLLYRVKGATEKKYINTIKVTLTPDTSNFETITSRKFTFDYSWVPDPHDESYIYVFGNQHHNSKDMPTLMYKAKNATTVKYIDDVKAILIEDKSDWIIPENIDDSNFDYSWYPSIHEPDQIYQFGTQWQKTGGPRLVVNNGTHVKFVDFMRVTKLPDQNSRNFRPLLSNIEFDYSWHPDDTEPPYIYVFGNQWYDSIKMPTVLYRVKGATEKKYLDVNAKLLPNKDNYETLTDVNFDFDYSWIPDPDDPPYNYVFGNQWYDSIKMPTVMYKVKNAVTTKYIDTVKAKLLEDKNNWIVPIDIDDTQFDYSWVPDPDEPAYMYQFGTQWQKTGGPRYIVKDATEVKFIDVQRAIKLPNQRNFRIIEPIVKETFDFSWHPDSTEENYSYIFGNKHFDGEIMPTVVYKSKQTVGSKYTNDIKPELDIKIIKYVDSIYESVIDNKFDNTYAFFTKDDDIIDYYKLFDDKIDTLHVAGDYALVPRNTRLKIHDKLTDYHNVKFHYKKTIDPIDIVFISNGESCADENYEHLLSLNLPNRIVRVDGVNGRVLSQHAAAKISNTHWYFLVNAKLQVNSDFDFNWQPDILKSRRHYIFTATNPLNGLEYGHQAIVANNKTLTLNTIVRGLDFTMDSATEVIELNSGISRFNTSAWDTYRTSFRECIKLLYYKDDVSKQRLNIWQTVAEGNFAEYSLKGANDAVDYYNSVNGDLNKLMLSYDWDWIKERFNK